MMNIKTFRGKPVEVTAIEWDGTNYDEIFTFTNASSHVTRDMLYIETLEGTMRALPGDFIVRGTRGEFYPVKPDVMAAKYEEIKS